MMDLYKWKTKLKTRHKSNIKNEQACEEFTQNLTETIKTAVSEKDRAFEKIRLCCKDESSFRLHPFISVYCLTQYQTVCQNYTNSINEFFF